MSLVDEVVEKIPNLEYAKWKFLLSQSDEISPNKQEIKEKLLTAIKSENMVSYYVLLCEQLKWETDHELLEKMKKENEEKLKKFDDSIKDATDNLGESEVRDALLAKSHFYAKIGDKENAVSQYRLTSEKTVGSGQKLDIVFTLIRIGLFWMDHDLITRNIDKAKTMVEQGTDWDRRNRLKVYEALYYLSIRNFSQAASLFLETLSTFTAVELMDYDTYIYYTVLTSLVALNRVTLKQKVLDAPEVLAVIDNIPNLGTLMNSIYACNYSLFFNSLANITDGIKKDRFLSPHAGYYCKEMKIIAYTQMLESYRSVQLESMANAFGVTPSFLDKELSRFIAIGRLHCKIDKVGGVVETNRSDSKNSQYQVTIKSGDHLLNRIQKLSRVINL